MKRLIKRITSASLAAILSIVTLASPIKVSAAEASSPTTLEKANMVGSDVEGTFELTGITGIATGGYYKIDVPEGSTKLLIKKDFFKTADGANIILGENVEMEKPDEGGVISGIDFANNNKIVDSSPFVDTFKGFTKLTTVKNLGLAINAVGGNPTSLSGTFEGCTALKSVDIDLVSSVGKVHFINTFKGCTQLNSVNIKNANIYSINDLFGMQKEHAPAGEVSLVISNSKLDDESPVDDIADYFNGSIAIKNSTDLNGEGLDIGTLVKNDDKSNTGKISFDFTGSKINSIKGLVNGTWDSFTANNIFSTDTKTISAIFDTTTKLSKIPTITGTMPTALDVIEHPFKGLDLNNDADERSAITKFLKGLDLTKASRYSALFETEASRHSDSGYSFTDLSELTLNSSKDSVYEHFSGGTYLQDNFTTAKSFGGSYILPFEAWQYNDSEDVSNGTKITPDESGVTMAGTIQLTGFKYNPDKLKASTKYEYAKASIKVIDVATDKEYTGRYGGEVFVEDTSQYQEGTEYFEDELLQKPYDTTGKKLVAGKVLTLYYTSAPNTDNSQKDVTLNVVWEDTDATARPNTVKVEWKAETETGESTTGSTNITSNKIVSTQTETIKVPTKVEEKAVVKYTFTADLTGTGYGYETIVEDKPDTIKLVLKKGSSTPKPPAEKEPDYSVVSDMPTDWTANFIGDVTEITATLEDGSTRKLGQDGDVIKFTAEDALTPDAYAKVGELSRYTEHDFYTFNITILNGGKEYKVKSIDGSYEFIYDNTGGIYHASWRNFIVYNYPNGTDKTPVQVYSMYEPASSKIKVVSNTTGTHLTASKQIGSNAHPNYKYTVDITWDDKGHESNRPKNVTGSWAANDKTDQFTIVTDNTKYTQLGFVEVDSKLSDVKFTLDDIEGYTISDQSTSTYTKKFVLEYTGTTSEPGNGSGTGTGGSNNPTQPENDNFVEDIPSNVTVNYGKDTTKITATLDDGSTMPLVSDTTKTTVIVKRSDQTVYQKPAGLTSDKFIFFDISITIEEGGKVHNVKSVDSPIGVAVEIPTDCDKNDPIKVYHYTNGIMIEPEEVRNASVTGTHIVIPTSSYSFYGIAYSTADTEKRTITIDWDDVGYETDRPTSVVADWTATYANDTTLKGTVVFNRDTTLTTQTQTFDVAKKNNNSALVSVVSNVRAVNGYKIQPKTGDALGWTIKWDGLTAKVITHTFKFDFSDAPTAKRPTEYKFSVVGNYSDGYKENKEFTVAIGTDGIGSQKVSFDLERADAPGSKHEFTTWDYPEVDGFSLNSSGLNAVFKYNGGAGGNANQTVYPITVTFAGDNGNTDKRPTQVEITWTSVTKKTMTTTTGNAIIPLTNGVNSVTQNITIPNTTTEERTVTVIGPVINGYNMNVNGHTITYNYAQAVNPAQTKADFTIAFEDDNNKAGRRPAEIKITLADTAEAGNTVTTTVKIPDNVTTTTPTYTGSIQIPAGKTYSITKVENLPTGYTSSIEGLKATLKYTPETIEKTFKVVWEGDVEEVRPSSIQIPVKVGEETLQTLVLSKDTNWAATAKLPKYVRGVEVSYQLTPPTVTNYAASVSGDTITMKYTGTLTDKQKEAITENAEKEAEKEKEALYDYEAFDWIDYANRYPDLKKAFGYNKEALYAHYIKYGIAEGRVATWTSKYANINNDILAAYFPDDYKFKVKDPNALDEMVDQMNKGDTTETVTKEEDKGTVTVDENGNTVVTKDNNDGTVTETIIDKDGNVIQTKTYATGDNRMMVTSWVYIAIIVTALGLVAVYYSDFRKCSKAKKVINDFIES